MTCQLAACQAALTIIQMILSDQPTNINQPQVIWDNAIPGPTHHAQCGVGINSPPKGFTQSLGELIDPNTNQTVECWIPAKILRHSNSGSIIKR